MNKDLQRAKVGSNSQFPDSGRAPLVKPTNDSWKQQRLMIAALGLLLFALGSVLYSDRDFWFPDPPGAIDRSPSESPAPAIAPERPEEKRVVTPRKSRSKTKSAKASAPPEPSGASITATRTVLPPLEVQVIAGNSPRTLHPTNNAIQVDLERGAAPSRVAPEVPVRTETAAGITDNAAERVDVPADAGEVVSHSVTPAYPTLARQMKVQGSVVLLALIGRDGLIQDLHVLSGSPILANAAQQAVRQWHFKPHYQGPEPVETQARITVNFTISTN